ncbi:hypothetical protein [Blastochloris viridis]|uniref:Uncharacterized protein n=1 Tax=Blastochloris viridis TaxID=1079 RepID=A0A0S4Q109_BLAVI|nr:hypothetical protein [Blastochloris viridis]CUU41682.1 hypothetical protein BVIRIDIS_06750 [Blastochloris viridis]
MARLIVVKRIAFNVAPSIGTVLLVEGQRYEVSALNPHQRRDGKPTTLITWRGYCADCGQPFEQTSALTAKGLNRRCPQHRSPGHPVTTGGRQRKRRFLAARPPASPRLG